MRITFSASFRDAATELNRTADQLAAAQRQVASGQRLTKPSDDPAGASAAITDHATLGALDAYTQTADAATSRLTLVDLTLSDIVDKISAAQTAAVSARGSSQSQAQRDAAAASLRSISDTLAADFNLQFHGAYVFSGSLATTPPYTNTAGTISSYQGNAAVASVEIDQGRLLQISFAGGSIAQGSDSSDVFTVLSNLATAAQAGNSTGISQGLDALGRALDRATLAQTQVGSSLAALDNGRARLGATRLATDAELSKTEDANMASAITQMSQADTAYRAALGAFSKVGAVSLMDYLR